jgi:hypothetical protein
MSIVDSVSGSTAGLLTLHAIANGGAGGRSFSPLKGARGGDGRTSVSGSNPGGGAVHVIGEANGGFGGASGSQRGGAGGNAIVDSVIGTSLAGEPVDVSAIATGGRGGETFTFDNSAPGGDGGNFALGTVFGSSSAGGRVVVNAIGSGGRGGSNGGSGASASLLNAVDGETTGALELTQRAVGGAAGYRFTAAANTAGSAHSEIARSASVEALTLRSAAAGGEGAWQLALDSDAGDGGAASASANAVNATGAASSYVTAVGGQGGFNFRRSDKGSVGGTGATAVVDARARTLGDGHDVVVGAAAAPGDPAAALELPESGAYGGTGGSIAAGNFESGAGDGGSALSSSLGIAEGDSRVSVFDRAVGGDGGSAHPSFDEPSDAIVGSGGGARSSATALGGGGSALLADATARGGDAGFGGIGGDAFAASFVAGGGTVTSRATATGGGSRGSAVGSTALARADAEGTSGSATAIAASSGRSVRSVVATASASVASHVAAESAARVGSLDLVLRPAADVQAFAFVHAQPDFEAARDLLAQHSLVSSAFDLSVTEPLALLALGGAATDSGDPQSILLDAQVEIAFAVEATAYFDQLVVGLFDPIFSGEGFEELDFQIEREGTTIVNEHFEDLVSALAFFDDEVLELGAWGDGIVGDVDLRFALALRSGDPGASFSFGSAIGISAIPEPSTLVLLAIGLVWLAVQARRVRVS